MVAPFPLEYGGILQNPVKFGPRQIFEFQQMFHDGKALGDGGGASICAQAALDITGKVWFTRPKTAFRKSGPPPE
jgi:hypothetical protein